MHEDVGHVARKQVGCGGGDAGGQVGSADQLDTALGDLLTNGGAFDVAAEVGCCAVHDHGTTLETLDAGCGEQHRGLTARDLGGGDDDVKAGGLFVDGSLLLSLLFGAQRAGITALALALGEVKSQIKELRAEGLDLALGGGTHVVRGDDRAKTLQRTDGLQAIGTLKRLGAVVTAYDVRPASQGEVESLGAKFLDLGLDFSKGQGEGGYARALSAEEQAQQQAAVDEKAAGFDIIITTAKVPGRKPPVLLTAAGVKGLKRGAVIVDCAASDLGGNVEGSAVGEQVTEGGVKLIGAPYLASGVATTASNLLSRNVADILVHFVRDGKLGQDLTEELDDALVVAGRAAAPAAAADAEKSEK